MTPSPPPDTFAAPLARLSEHVRRRYGVAVVTGPVAAPFKGDLDGAEIVVGEEHDAQAGLFLVAHLFGHTVQWNTSPAARRLGMRMPVHPDGPLLDALEAYEREACRYSLQALHEAGVTHLDQWLADHSACDQAYLRHFYQSGERLPFSGFWREGTPPLEPLAIPPFTPRRWRRRGRAIVL
jgi:hypothetical protein